MQIQIEKRQERGDVILKRRLNKDKNKKSFPAWLRAIGIEILTCQEEVVLSAEKRVPTNFIHAKDELAVKLGCYKLANHTEVIDA